MRRLKLAARKVLPAMVPKQHNRAGPDRCSQGRPNIRGEQQGDSIVYNAIEQDDRFGDNVKRNQKTPYELVFKISEGYRQKQGG